MALELAAELDEHGDARLVEDVARQPADRHVVAERPGEQRVVGRPERGVGGKQDLLLLAEVSPPVLIPVGAERRAHLVGGGVAGPAQAQGDEQRLVVVVGERGQRGVALHEPVPLTTRHRRAAARSAASGPRSVIRQPACMDPSERRTRAGTPARARR